MERVKKGEKYWWITSLGCIFNETETYHELDDKRYNLGNYFATKESAEQMARKLRAVLNGADVVEIPDEYETQNYTNSFRESACVDCRYCNDTVCVLEGFSQFHLGQYRRPGLCSPYKSKIVK